MRSPQTPVNPGADAPGFLSRLRRLLSCHQRVEVETLRQAIAKLPEKQRSRLVLYYFGDFTYEQIAEMEGCSKRAVKFSVDIALKNLKKFS